MVDSLSSYQTDTICLELLSPDKVGYYQGQWRMCTPTGIYFGGKLLACCDRWYVRSNKFSYSIAVH